MKGLDAGLALISLAAFLWFIGIVSMFVLEANLIVVFLIGAGLAIYDFWRSFRQRRDGNGGS